MRSLYRKISFPTFNFLLGVGVAVLLLLRIILYFCAEILEKSKEYPMSYIRNDISLSKLEVYYYKARAPITFDLGQFSTINRVTNLYVLCEDHLFDLALVT